MLRQCDAIFVHEKFMQLLIEENKPSTWQQIEALDMIKASKREFKAKKQRKSDDIMQENVRDK